jgi:hypothetical protein
MIVTGQPLQGRAHDVAQEGHRQAPPRHPELRRDGRPVHRQDRHADPGPRRARALRGRDQPDKRGRAALRVHEQLYQTGLRNLLDRAILAHTDLDVERNCKKVDEIPFDFKRRRMSVVIDYEDRHVLICKGAVEEIFALRQLPGRRGHQPAHPADPRRPAGRVPHAERPGLPGARDRLPRIRPQKSVFAVADESELILLGYIAFFDPPKDTSARAIEALGRSGVTVKILTGDNELVTRKVCNDVGMRSRRSSPGRSSRRSTKRGFAGRSPRPTCSPA